MKIAKKSPSGRFTITLPASTYELIDALREGQPRSVFVEGLVESEKARRDRRQLLARLQDEYTPTVRRETLRANEEFPIHDV